VDFIRIPGRQQPDKRIEGNDKAPSSTATAASQTGCLLVDEATTLETGFLVSAGTCQSLHWKTGKSGPFSLKTYMAASPEVGWN
jgi:hypothetical protein